MKNFLKSVLLFSLLVVTTTRTFAGEVLKQGTDEKTRIQQQ